jgi:hypothetical protein
MRILDTMTRRTQTQDFKLCKVQWSQHSKVEVTREKEDILKEEFPHLFKGHSES